MMIQFKYICIIISTLILSTMLFSSKKALSQTEQVNTGLSALQRQYEITSKYLNKADQLLQDGIISQKEYNTLKKNHQKASDMLDYYQNKDKYNAMGITLATTERSETCEKQYNKLVKLHQEGLVSEHELLEAELNYKYSYNNLDTYKSLLNLEFNAATMINPLDIVLKTPLKHVTSKFGYRMHPITGLYSLHAGIDIAAPAGTPVYAYEDGFVIQSTCGNLAGNFIQIMHGDSFSSLYLHLKKRAVKASQLVKKGQLIGYIGSTGRSTGNHLHFEIRKNGISQNINYLILQ